MGKKRLKDQETKSGQVSSHQLAVVGRGMGKRRAEGCNLEA
jgi:hypothetical protein